MKKILFILPSLCVGGLERMLVTIANALAARGYDVTVLTLQPDRELASELDASVHFRYRAPKPHPLMKKIPYIRYAFYDDGLWETRASAKTLYQYYVGNETFDVEIGFFRGLSIKIISGSTNREAKHFAWVHSDFKKAMYTANFKNKAAVRKAYAAFDRVFCVSGQAKENFCAEIGLEEKAEVLYNMLPADEIRKKAEEDVIKKGNRLTLLSVGRLACVKGYDRLLSAVKRLGEEGFDFDLWLVGGGEEKTALETYAKENRLDNVRFFGMQKNPYPYMKQADIYVCSSRFEGFNLTVAEALICGLPVVSTDCTGPVEILRGGEYGLLCENSEEGIYEGLKRMLTDDSLRRKYAESAPLRGADFDEKALCEELISKF